MSSATNIISNGQTSNVLSVPASAPLKFFDEQYAKQSNVQRLAGVANLRKGTCQNASCIHGISGSPLFQSGQGSVNVFTAL